jgi:hypothetical protein
MRENRPYGSEGGGALTRPPYPYQRTPETATISIAFGIFDPSKIRKLPATA